MAETKSKLSWEKSFEQRFQTIHKGLKKIQDWHPDDDKEPYTIVTSQLNALDEKVQDLLTQVFSFYELSLVDQADLPDDSWKPLGKGNFGAVFKINFQGSDSAIKVFTSYANSKLKERDSEVKRLRGLSHDNIIAYRGTGYVTRDRLEKLVPGHLKDCGDSMRFLIMQYIERNLDDHVMRITSEEAPGLTTRETVFIGQELANALNYLHGKDIAHRDLKPDNILYDSGKRILKVADFGLAWSNDFVNTESVSGSSSSIRSHGGKTSQKNFSKNVRWGAPELSPGASDRENVQQLTVDRYKIADIWCYGMIMGFLITGKKPFSSLETDDIGDDSDLNPVALPNNLQSELKEIVESCRQIKPEDRPTAGILLSKYSKEMKAKLLMEPEEKEFFTCGFMDKTDIFVADSCVSELTEGYIKTHVRPMGYCRGFLNCPVATEVNLDAQIPESDIWIHYGSIMIIICRFIQSEYCHHRAMREIWRDVLSSKERHIEVPCKAVVHWYFSTSFGLHVAVLTNEGPGRPQKFIFCRRARRAGVASPGFITCGAVESCSVNDFVDSTDDSGERVDLVKTAVRGLHEELGLQLTGSDLDAITLNTVYLKFDTHEWGMCGFVDLTDERIRLEHRISAQNLEARFLGGAKDKFEHDAIMKVDFTLDAMVNFVFQKYQEFASSGKLVVVKVMQAYFGVDAVQRAFEVKGAARLEF